MEINKNPSAYIVKACRGPTGCSNAIHQSPEIIEAINSVFTRLDFDPFIIAKSSETLKIHQQFKVFVSYCPNSCSMPQIADIGIIFAGPVKVSNNPCSHCNACLMVCIEKAIRLDEKLGPEIIRENCLFCGKCAKVCPRETIINMPHKYRIMVGGRLGRHPRLATELPGIHSKKDAVKIVENSIRLFMENYPKATRFSDLFSILAEGVLFDRLGVVRS